MNNNYFMILYASFVDELIDCEEIDIPKIIIIFSCITNVYTNSEYYYERQIVLKS